MAKPWSGTARSSGVKVCRNGGMGYAVLALKKRKAAEHLAQSGTLNAEVGQAFIDRLPYSVKANVRAGAL